LLLAVIGLVGLLVLSCYIMRGELTSILKKKLEARFSDMVGYDVQIGALSGNIFNRIVLQDLNFRFKKYDIGFDRAKLEYSLFDIVSGRESFEKEKEIFISLEKGSLALAEKILISKEINGRIRVNKQKITLDSLDFKLFDLLDINVEGVIITESRPLRVDLQIKAEPFFDKDRRFFAGARASIKGGIDNLSLYADMKGGDGLNVLINGYAIFSKGLLNLGSRMDFETPQSLQKGNILMNAEIDLKKSHLAMILIPAEGRIRIDSDYSQWPLLKTDVRNEHIKIYGLDFSNIMHLSSRSVHKKWDFSHVILDIATESSILNYSPIDEIEASVWIDRDILRLIYVKAGDTISTSGALTLKPPRKAFLRINIADFDISQPFLILEGTQTPIASGRLSGEVLIEGPLDNLTTKISLEALEGHLGTILYENMIVNLDGTGPMLEVHDSRLVRQDSFLKLDGVVDTREFGNDKFLEQVTISSDEETIIWEGWDISRRDESDELNLSKGLGGGVRIGFKTQAMKDETAYETVKPHNEFQLEYSVPEENSALQFKAKENEEFLGIIKKYKF